MGSTQDKGPITVPWPAAAVMNAIVVMLLYVGLATIAGITPTRNAILIFGAGAVVWEVGKATIHRRKGL